MERSDGKVSTGARVWIKGRAKEIAAEEVLEENPFMAWEARDDLTETKLSLDAAGYLLLAIMDYLDGAAR